MISGFELECPSAGSPRQPAAHHPRCRSPQDSAATGGRWEAESGRSGSRPWRGRSGRKHSRAVPAPQTPDRESAGDSSADVRTSSSRERASRSRLRLAGSSWLRSGRSSSSSSSSSCPGQLSPAIAARAPRPTIEITIRIAADRRCTSSVPRSVSQGEIDLPIRGHSSPLHSRPAAHQEASPPARPRNRRDRPALVNHSRTRSCHPSRTCRQSVLSPSRCTTTPRPQDGAGPFAAHQPQTQPVRVGLRLD